MTGQNYLKKNFKRKTFFTTLFFLQNRCDSRPKQSFDGIAPSSSSSQHSDSPRTRIGDSSPLETSPTIFDRVPRNVSRHQRRAEPRQLLRLPQQLGRGRGHSERNETRTFRHQTSFVNQVLRRSVAGRNVHSRSASPTQRRRTVGSLSTTTCVRHSGKTLC